MLQEHFTWLNYILSNTSHATLVLWDIVTSSYHLLCILVPIRNHPRCESETVIAIFVLKMTNSEISRTITTLYTATFLLCHNWAPWTIRIMPNITLKCAVLPVNYVLHACTRCHCAVSSFNVSGQSVKQHVSYFMCCMNIIHSGCTAISFLSSLLPSSSVVPPAQCSWSN